MSVGCLNNVIRASGRCLEGVLRVPGCPNGNLVILEWCSQDRSSKGKAGQVKLGQIRSSQDRSSQDRVSYDRSTQDRAIKDKSNM